MQYLIGCYHTHSKNIIISSIKHTQHTYYYENGSKHYEREITEEFGTSICNYCGMVLTLSRIEPQKWQIETKKFYGLFDYCLKFANTGSFLLSWFVIYSVLENIFKKS